MRWKMATAAGASAACLAVAISAAVAHPLPPLPTTPRANADMGARFAVCAAYDLFAADVAGRANLPQIKLLQQARARDWRFGGIFFVGRGLVAAAAATAPRGFDTATQAELAELSAKLGADPGKAMTETSRRYDRDCASLEALQQGVVEALRTGEL